MTDEGLVENLKNGDDGAFEELMQRHVGAIFNFARHYANNAEDAEDIAQDSFFKAWKYIGRFKDGKSFKPWLFAIARNTALDFVKKKHAVSFSELYDSENDADFAENIADDGPMPPDIFAHAETSGKIASVLLSLHPDHRSVLTLHYHEEMTFEEISAVMGKPMNTVKSWHRRALSKIKPMLVHQKDL